MPAKPHWEQLIAPLSQEHFVRTYLGQQFVHIIPQPAHQPLLTWDRLNDALMHLRVVGTRVKMFQNGEACTPDTYLGDLQNPFGALLRTAAAVRLLKNGATLVLDQAGELFDSIGSIAESLTESFRIPVSSNLYLGFGRDRG